MESKLAVGVATKATAVTTPGGKTAYDAVLSGASPLSDRAREVLRDIIRAHVLSGEPVSSRAVSRHWQPALSAATIRNVMADLEEAGLLIQPHTSAGRVPTQAAYRLYVEVLMGHRELPARDRRYIEEHLWSAGTDADQLLSAATHLLSELSNQVGVVLIPAVEEAELQGIDFVLVGPRKVLCIVVTTTGFVDNVLIEVEEDLSRDELQRISTFVTSNFAGMKLRGVRDELLRRMTEERAQVDRWLQQAIELARRAVDNAQEQEVLVEGTTTLLHRPELADVDRIRQVFDTFADKAKLVRLLNRCLASDRVRVFMGEDTDVTSELEFSFVATSYGIGRETRGSLGILGPSRMEYPRMVPLVRFLGEALSRALAPSAC